MNHYVYRNLQATEISKLQLIISLYVVYIWPVSYTHLTLPTILRV